MIQVSIPGKIHLIGEHSVVYGKTAILASINLKLSAKIEPSKRREIIGIVQYDDAIKKMQSSIENKITQKFKVKIPPYKIEIDKTKIPVGSGLGTSASLSAAFTICLLKFLKLKYSKKDVFEIALEGEKIFHGNPSGGDLMAVLTKGLILFQKNNQQILIKSIPDKLPVSQFILIDSGKPEETTSEMVTFVSKKDTKAIFNSQQNLADLMLESINTNNKDQFLLVIKNAERNLEKLGVVGDNAKKIIQNLAKINAAAKITGAGGIKKGSGMILAFHKDPNVIVEFAKKENLVYYSVRI